MDWGVFVEFLQSFCLVLLSVGLIAQGLFNRAHTAVHTSQDKFNREHMTVHRLETPTSGPALPSVEEVR